MVFSANDHILIKLLRQ